MRILHIVENLELGGLENFVIDLTAEQSITNHNVKVVCLFERGVLSRQCEGNGVNVQALHKSRGSLIKTSLKLRKVIKDFKPDVIHTHNPMSNYYASLAALFLGIRLINTRHGRGETNVTKLSFLLYKLSIINTSYVVTVSRDAFNSFIKRNLIPKDRSLVIENGINCMKIPSYSTKRADFHNELGIEKGTVVIGFISRLSIVKDHYSLLIALAKLKGRGGSEKFHLIIIGDGENADRISQHIRDLNIEKNVSMIGAKPNAYTYLQYFDIFALITHTEGYPITLVEACCAGVPIIATNVGGVSEIVCDGYNGFLVKESDSDDICEKVNLLASDEERRNEISLNCSKWAQAHASIASCSLRYLKLYTEK